MKSRFSKAFYIYATFKQSRFQITILVKTNVTLNYLHYSIMKVTLDCCKFHFIGLLFYFAIVKGRPPHDTFEQALKCTYFNESTSQQSISDVDYEDNKESPYIECEPASSCFTVWRNDSKGIQILNQGCFSKDTICKDQKVCKAYDRKNNYIFCCCESDFCNKKFIYEPSPTLSSAIVDEPVGDNEINVGLLWGLKMLLLGCGLGAVFLTFHRRPQCLRKRHSLLVDRSHIEDRAQTSEIIYPIELIEQRATGRFGAVWKGKMKNEIVAVKVFPTQEKQSWLTEQEIFKLPLMEHDNILKFIGAEKHDDNVQKGYWLITAYHELGSLNDYLRDNTVNLEQLCVISFTMARGLAHLHKEVRNSKPSFFKPSVAHRDFKSSNVLLKSDLSACIADFGLAMVFKSQNCGNTHSQVGTRRYMAPEILDGVMNFSCSAFLRIDMYACGLVLWEVLSRCTAHENAEDKYALPFEAELGEHPNIESLQEHIVLKMRRPELKQTWKNNPSLAYVCTIIDECWDTDPEARLSAACVAERFSGHLQCIAKNETKLLYNIL